MPEGPVGPLGELAPNGSVSSGGTVATFGVTAQWNGVVVGTDTEDDGGQSWTDATMPATPRARMQERS